jgi:hypothetical protein
MWVQINKKGYFDQNIIPLKSRDFVATVNFHELTHKIKHVWQGSFGLWILTTLSKEPEPKELQIVASPDCQLILTRERKTTLMNNAAIVQDVGAGATRSLAKHVLNPFYEDVAKTVMKNTRMPKPSRKKITMFT